VHRDGHSILLVTLCYATRNYGHHSTREGLILHRHFSLYAGVYVSAPFLFLDVQYIISLRLVANADNTLKCNRLSWLFDLKQIAILVQFALFFLHIFYDGCH